MEIFNSEKLKNLYKPAKNSSGEDNGSVTIIGGSSLFHGAPILALKAASRIVDMVYFGSPERRIGEIADTLKSKLMSFIWVPWKEVEYYVAKSDAILIGPGMMRFTSESQNPKPLPRWQAGKFQMTNNREGRKTRNITKRLLLKYPNKKWVIDAGSLQTMESEWIPKKAVLTPNIKEFELLFELKTQDLILKTTTEKLKLVREQAERFNCTIVLKGPETIVASPDESIVVKGGNPGLTKGGTGDVLAGLTVALLAKNDSFLAASAASYIEKKTAEELSKERGIYFNADDLADKIPEVFHKTTGNK